MINILNLKKIFCWSQDPDGRTPHGLAMGEDGITLSITPACQPEDIMRIFSTHHTLFDDHFGKGQWELVFVPKADVDEMGRNLDFEMAMGKNALLAQQAGLNKVS